jgi:hypothetical protein
MTYRELSEQEWNEILDRAIETARQTAREYIKSLYQESNRGTASQPKHEKEGEYIRQALEKYRNEPPESNIRKGIECLISVHAKRQESIPEWEREQYRKRHNALVLSYLIETPMSVNQISKRLQVSWQQVKALNEKGISELSQICFGYTEYE